MTQLESLLTAIPPEQAHKQRRKLPDEFIAEVLAVIKARTAENPIRAEDLARHFNQPHDRYVRAAIRVLIERQHPIAAVTNKNRPGYFYARTRQEADRYIRSLRSRAIDDFIRLRDFAQAAQATLNVRVEQLKLEI